MWSSNTNGVKNDIVVRWKGDAPYGASVWFEVIGSCFPTISFSHSGSVKPEDEDEDEHCDQDDKDDKENLSDSE